MIHRKMLAETGDGTGRVEDPSESNRSDRSRQGQCDRRKSHCVRGLDDTEGEIVMKVLVVGSGGREHAICY